MAQEPTSNPTPLAEIDHGPSKFEQFLEDNLKKIILAAFLLVLGVAGYIVVSGMETAKDTSAGEALQAASDIAAYRDVIENFPATPAAGSAALFIAEQQWKDGSQEESISTLRSFISDSPDHPAVGNARLSLASHLIAQEKAEEAKPLLEEIAKDPKSKHIAAFALLTLGDLAAQEGHEDSARTHYESALNDFPDSNPSTNSLATRRLSLLGVESPAKISAPAVDPDTSPATETAPPADTPLFPPITPAEGTETEAEAPSAPAEEEETESDAAAESSTDAEEPEDSSEEDQVEE